MKGWEVGWRGRRRWPRRWGRRREQGSPGLFDLGFFRGLCAGF